MARPLWMTHNAISVSARSHRGRIIRTSIHRILVTSTVALFALGSGTAVAGQTTTVPLPQAYKAQVVDSADANTVIAASETNTVIPAPTKPSSDSKKKAKKAAASDTVVVASILPVPATDAAAVPTSVVVKQTPTKPAKKTKKKSTPTTVVPTSVPTVEIESAVDSAAKPEIDAAGDGAKKSTTKKQKAGADSSAPAAAVLAKADSGNTALDAAFAALRKCESGGNYKINTGNGYYGAYQFAASTWRSLGYSGLPHQAEPAVQDEAAKKLQAKAGWGQWPACSRKLGLR
jgi:resuscitation-promoting factor RpfB